MRGSISIEKLPKNLIRMPGRDLFLKNFKAAVDDFLDLIEPRKKHVIIRRYGLDGKPPDVLKNIGVKLNLTRERIRQIEKRVFSDICQLFQGPPLRKPPCQVHSDLLIDFERLRSLILSHLVLSEDQTLEIIPHESKENPYLLLFFEIIGIKKLCLSNNTLYVDVDKVNESVLFKSIISIKDFLAQKPAFHSMEEICNNTQVEYYLIEPILEAVHFVETKVGDSGKIVYAMSLPFLRRHQDKVCRILQEAGEPLHLSEIQKRIEKKEASSSSRFYVCLDERLTPVGGTGYWGLSEWGYKTETIEEMAVRILSKFRKAMYPRDIYEEFRRTRPDVAFRSLTATIYLKKDRFKFLEDGKIILKKWEHRYKKLRKRQTKKVLCTQKEFDHFLVKFIGLKGEKSTPEIARRAVDEFGLSYNGAATKILLSKILVKRKASKKIHYRVLPNYVEVINKKFTSPKKERIKKLAFQYLRRRTKAVPMKTLINWLTEKGGFERQTIYGVLRDNKSFRKTSISSKEKLVELSIPK